VCLPEGHRPQKESDDSATCAAKATLSSHTGGAQRQSGTRKAKDAKAE